VGVVVVVGEGDFVLVEICGAALVGRQATSRRESIRQAIPGLASGLDTAFIGTLSNAQYLNRLFVLSYTYYGKSAML
jgi:hypothetical protein